MCREVGRYLRACNPIWWWPWRLVRPYPASICTEQRLHLMVVCGVVASERHITWRWRIKKALRACAALLLLLVQASWFRISNEHARRKLAEYLSRLSTAADGGRSHVTVRLMMKLWLTAPGGLSASSHRGGEWLQWAQRDNDCRPCCGEWLHAASHRNRSRFRADRAPPQASGGSAERKSC